MLFDGKKRSSQPRIPIVRALAVVMAAVLLVHLSACGAEQEFTGQEGLYIAESATLDGITVPVDSVFEDGFSMELKNGGKAVFHYDGKDYSLKWSVDGRLFHAEGSGAELDGTLDSGVMLLENVLDSGLQIRLSCEELLPRIMDGQGTIVASDGAEGKPETSAVSPREPVLEALKNLPVYGPEESMAMSSWIAGGYCIIEDDVFYGRFFRMKESFADFVALQLLHNGIDVKAGTWIVLDDTGWPNYVHKQGETLYYLRHERGGSACDAVVRVQTDGADRQILYEGVCDFLCLKDERLFFTDGENRLVSCDLQGGDMRTVLDKEVFYPYLLDEDWIVYQDDADSETLHLYYLPQELDLRITESPSYDPVLSGSSLFFNVRDSSGEGFRLARVDLQKTDAVYDEKNGCSMPVFMIEYSDNRYSGEAFFDGTRIRTPGDLAGIPLENWKNLNDTDFNYADHTIRYLSTDWIVRDVFGKNGNVKSVYFVDTATLTDHALHWLH